MTDTAMPRPADLTSLPHSGQSVGTFYLNHFIAAFVPLVSGLILYGWRAAVVVLLVGAGAAAGTATWRRIGPRGAQLDYPHAMWLALLLAMMLPPHLVTTAGEDPPWYLLPAAGLLLAIFLWIFGGLGGARIHPVLVTYLMIAALFFQTLVPHWVLQRKHAFTGDVLRGTETRHVLTESWSKRPPIPASHAEYIDPASEALTKYTTARQIPPRGWLPIESLLRDDLPPLDDLLFAGHPSPVGLGSAIFVIIGGLFLLYKGVIDFRIPVIIILADLAALMILPTPSILTTRVHWTWVVSRQIGWATGFTFANYELAASPALFMAFFLATSPSIRPMSRRGRILYALIAGIGSAALQLYFSVALGPYIALLLASLVTPLFDAWFGARALV